jgi:peptide/nickel transport system permease protein
VTAVELELAPPRAGGRRRLWRRFARNRPALAGLVVATVFGLAALLAPLVAPADPNQTVFAEALQPPSPAHWLGTDDLGRDQLSRVIYGLRASLLVGLLAVALAMAVAVPLGLLAGYYRRWFDPAVSRLTDTLLAFPFLVLAVGLAAILGPSLLNATIAIGIAEIPRPLRVIRGETISLREEDYVEAAVANGASDLVILGRHVLPNALSRPDRAGDRRHPAGDHRRGGAVVPRSRGAAADAVARRDARQRPAVHHPGAMAGGLPRPGGRAGGPLLQPDRRRPARRPRPKGVAVTGMTGPPRQATPALGGCGG